ncbi:MAG: hydrogenase maturation nickel metallochaperone HypA [Desulfocapsaceae bacterium]|nr:hydrogenase maturation nickel metallochaperone HypA [Desulfocapsaceae bacterium]
MHEMSLVQAMLAQLASLAAEHDKKKVITVTLDIGPLSGVVIDSFQFGFDILSAESSLTKGAKLIITNTPASYQCIRCAYKQAAVVRPDHCPKCNETLLIPEGGDTIILNQVEME